MAHVTKFSRAASGHMFKHFERSKDENGDYIKFSNQSIDPARTSENYNLAPARDISQGDYIRQRCAEPGVTENKRKDLNVMCSWIVTLPQELPVSEHRQFFEQSYRFMADRYGGDQNVVSAYVHMDEVRPHMHFAFVPVVADQKHGGYKVSAKDAVNRHDLQTFHADLDRHMEQVYGRNIGILNEATKEGNKSIEELRRGDAVRKVEELHQQATEAQQTLTGAIERLQEVVKEQNTSEDVLERLRRDTEQAQQGLREVQKAVVRTTSTADKYAEQKRATADREAEKAIRDAQRDAADLRDQAEKEARQTVAQAKGEADAIRAEIPALRSQRDQEAQELERLRANTHFTDFERGKPIKTITGKVRAYEVTPEQHDRYIALRIKYNDQSREIYMLKNEAGDVARLSKENRQLRQEVGELKEAVTTRDTYIGRIYKFFDQNPEIGHKAMNFVNGLEKEAEKAREAAEKVRGHVRDIFPSR